MNVNPADAAPCVAVFQLNDTAGAAFCIKLGQPARQRNALLMIAGADNYRGVRQTIQQAEEKTAGVIPAAVEHIAGADQRVRLLRADQRGGFVGTVAVMVGVQIADVNQRCGSAGGQRQRDGIGTQRGVRDIHRANAPFGGDLEFFCFLL